MFLFGDNISESIESLSKEHKIKYLHKDKVKGNYEAISNKKKYAELSNWKSSSKSSKRTEVNSGQRFKNLPQKRPSQNKSYHQSQHQAALLPAKQELNKVSKILDIQGILQFFQRETEEFQAGSVKHTYASTFGKDRVRIY